MLTIAHASGSQVSWLRPVTQVGGRSLPLPPGSLHCPAASRGRPTTQTQFFHSQLCLRSFKTAHSPWITPLVSHDLQRYLLDLAHRGASLAFWTPGHQPVVPCLPHLLRASVGFYRSPPKAGVSPSSIPSQHPAQCSADLCGGRRN